jgi:hypothetical protein
MHVRKARMRRSRLTPRWVWIVWAALMAALMIGLGLWVVQGVVRGVPGPVISGVYVDGPLDALIVVAYAVTGAVLASIAAILVTRVSHNPIGWILGAVAAWLATTFLLIMWLYFLHSPGDTQTAFANWLGNWTFVISVPTSLVLMIFPTGALPSPRWRILPWLAIIGIAGWVTLEAASDVLGLGPVLPNPYANPQLTSVANFVSILLLPALVGTVASLVVRYRWSSPEVRFQIKWAALAGAFQISVWVFVWAVEAFRPQAFGIEVVAVGTLSLIIVPVALSVAISKYRLYDIDRLVSRTVSYAMLAVLLAGVFVGGVIGIQSLFGVTDDLAVAGTTLAAAALFNPLRHRLHDLMDRQFNRSRFDAEHVVEAFSSRINSVTDSDEFASDLSATLESTLAPASIGIWIRA